MLLLRLFAVTVLSVISITLCQQPTVPASFYPTLPRAKRQLGQEPALRKFAVRRGSRVYTEIKRRRSSIIAEEGVNVNIDCFPWLDYLTSTKWEVKWVLQRRNESGASESIYNRVLFSSLLWSYPCSNLVQCISYGTCKLVNCQHFKKITCAKCIHLHSVQGD